MLVPFIGSSMEKNNDDNEASTSDSVSFIEKNKNLLNEKNTDGEGDESTDSGSYFTSTDSSENQESSSSSELLVLTDVKEKEKQKLKLLLQEETLVTQEELVSQGLPLGNIFENKTGKSLFGDHQFEYHPRNIFDPERIDLTKSKILASYKERKKIKERLQENSPDSAASTKNEQLMQNNFDQQSDSRISNNHYETNFLKNFKNANSIKEFRLCERNFI